MLLGHQFLATEAAPHVSNSKQCLWCWCAGAAQTLAALVRGVGPALGGLSWALSLRLVLMRHHFLATAVSSRVSKPLSCCWCAGAAQTLAALVRGVGPALGGLSRALSLRLVLTRHHFLATAVSSRVSEPLSCCWCAGAAQTLAALVRGVGPALGGLSRALSLRLVLMRHHVLATAISSRVSKPLSCCWSAGAAQTLAAFVRAVGPALGGLSWALSLRLALPGHQFLAFALVSVGLAATRVLYGFVRLPGHVTLAKLPPGGAVE